MQDGESELKIGLIGHYGCQEFCDDAMALTIKKTFDGLSSRKIRWFYLDEIRQAMDLVILGGGSLIGDNLFFHALASYLKRVDCPLCIFGSGVRDVRLKLPELQYVWDRASSISVRGKTSVERLEEFGVDTSNIFALGDPIFLWDGTGSGKENRIGGVVRPHNVDLQWMKKVFEFLKTVRGQKVKLFSFSVPQGDKKGGELLGYETFALSPAETYYAVKKSSFWFGNRLHAFCLALIESVPSIGVEIEFRKVEDVCSLLEYPYWLRSGEPFEQLYYDLSDNWGAVNKAVQNKIRVVKENLTKQAKNVLEMMST